VQHAESKLPTNELGKPEGDFGLVSQACFENVLYLEQKRTERSGKSLVLMLVHFDRTLVTENRGRNFEKVLSALGDFTRETDIKGWYRDGAIVGVIFTEILAEEATSVAEVLLDKVRSLIAAKLPNLENSIELTVQIFPHDVNKQGKDGKDWALPIAFRDNRNRRKSALAAKRCLDIAGSLLAIGFFSPVFAGIALAVKLTSKGPILFRQQRVGQYAQTFQFLKFRSMYTGNDHGIHQEYVKDLISGKVGANKEAGGQPNVFKLINDPRITPLGRFLRRTSLDELPQFFNVLKGQMSLVGPRPPIPYEVEHYEVWHRARLFAVKPGITGLWQVKGRSRTTFDEMVRLDLQYARTWTVWMDLRILLQTPRAMVSGDGAH
jgi:lipopolysaccharide/colanic/teichoic acid biosynthesis glycosyltransferase